ncbi:MAG: hypothetical protein AB1898_11130 [Acidobacteriota bacterium]
MKNQFGFALLATMILTLFPGAASIKAAQHEHGAGVSQIDRGSSVEQTRAVKVGKKGEIEFSSDTQLGDISLRRGRYQFQHRVEGSDHFVHFTELTKSIPYSSYSGPKAHPGEVKCRVEPLEKKVSRTTVYSRKENGVYRLTRIEVAGENVAHVF